MCNAPIARERFTFGTKERERDLKPEPGKGDYIPKTDRLAG